MSAIGLGSRSGSRGARAGLVLGGLVVWTAACADPARLLVHLDFDDLDDAKTTNRAGGQSCAVRKAESAPGVTGRALKVGGHPDQAVELGVLGCDQPVTFALWIKRAATPSVEKSGEQQPEYLQEHSRGQGRLLSRVNDGTAQRLAGAVRVGPEKLEVWHGRAWATLIAEPLPAEIWIHLTIVFDEQRQATGYLNGRKAATISCGFDGRVTPMALVATAGERHYGFPFAGCVDDVRVYQGLLTEPEIAALATPPSATRLATP